MEEKKGQTENYVKSFHIQYGKLLSYYETLLIALRKNIDSFKSSMVTFDMLSALKKTLPKDDERTIIIITYNDGKLRICIYGDLNNIRDNNNKIIGLLDSYPLEFNFNIDFKTLYPMTDKIKNSITYRLKKLREEIKDNEELINQI